MEIILYIAAATLVIYFAARLAAAISHRKHKCVKSKPKLPGYAYRVIYSDRKQNDEYRESTISGTVLKCERLNISGKPDYIYRHKNGELVPVELKSGEIGEAAEPYPGDLMQLASYFAIVEECFEERPAYGLVVYKDYMFKIKNTARLRRALRNVLKDMRDMLTHGEANPAASFVKCRNCMCKGTVCEYAE